MGSKDRQGGRPLASRLCPWRILVLRRASAASIELATWGWSLLLLLEKIQGVVERLRKVGLHRTRATDVRRSSSDPLLHISAAPRPIALAHSQLFSLA